MSTLSLKIANVSVVVEDVETGERSFAQATDRVIHAAAACCDGAGCTTRYTVSVRKRESDAGAMKRATREALRGAWRRVGGALYCGRCAAAKGTR